MEKIVKLETKVQAWIEYKELGKYSVRLKQKEGKEVCLEIKAEEGTYGQWSWYLTSLFRMDNNYQISDKLSLDFGQHWYVTGMKKVYNEVMTKLSI